MDNTTHDDTKTLDEWTALFGERDFVELVHIPVHAIMHQIFIEVLDEPELLESEVVSYSLPYKNSWEYVQENGYETIVNKLQKLYKKGKNYDKR